MVKVIYPGTFDPPTLGHLNIIKRAARLFEHMEVAIGYDSQKQKPFFSSDEREGFLKTLTEDLPNVSVSSFEGLLVEHAKKLSCTLIVRSVRSYNDYERETA